VTAWHSFEIAADDQPAATIILLGEGASIADASRARVEAATRSAAFEPKPGRWLDVLGPESADRLIFIALADGKAPGRWRSAGGHIVEAIRALGLKAARLPVAAELESEDAFAQLLEGVLLHSFRLEQERSLPIPGLFAGRLLIAPTDTRLLDQARRAAEPVNRARAWVERPANLLTPAIFADEAEAALTAHGVTVRQLGPAELAAIGAGGILAVAAGSENEPRLVVAEWRGAPEREGWDVALVGKGLTFDAGGLNLKPRPGIAKMKFDMAGAAAALGALESIAARRVPKNIVAVIPMSENNIDGKSFRPGDVITSLAGLTIDVQDTDAEGRIVLADAITYAIQHHDPAYIVDIATLTGSIMATLHEEFAGLFTSDDALAELLSQAGRDTQEHLWRMPLADSQDYLVDSPVADVSNLGAPGWFGTGGGSAVAGAKFIERFAKDRRWAHLDIAGTGWATRRTTRSTAGATGFGVALLDRWVDLIP
jgi:leucyl aminopeptidase